MPNKTQRIDKSVNKLRNLGLIKTVEADGTIHYCLSEQLKSTRKRIREITLNDKIEGEIIQRVGESVLQRLYPGVSTIDSGIFSSSNESSHLDLIFDIIIEFSSSVMGKKFVVIDVFTMIPVTEQIIQSFVRRIKTVRTKIGLKNNREEAHYPLRGKTIGIIIFNEISQKAVEVARECEISLMHFRDIQIDYNRICKEFAAS